MQGELGTEVCEGGSPLRLGTWAAVRRPQGRHLELPGTKMPLDKTVACGAWDAREGQVDWGLKGQKGTERVAGLDMVGAGREKGWEPGGGWAMGWRPGPAGACTALASGDTGQTAYVILVFFLLLN